MPHPRAKVCVQMTLGRATEANAPGWRMDMLGFDWCISAAACVVEQSCFRINPLTGNAIYFII
jgi:hypothetical protein